MININEKFVYLQRNDNSKGQIIHADFSSLTTQKSFQTFDEQRYIDLKSFLKLEENIQDLEIFVPQNNEYQNVQSSDGIQMRVPLSYLQTNVIMLRYKQQGSEQSYNLSNNLRFQKSIKDRDRSRTIKQLLTYVKKWRELADQKNTSLQKAAQIVGISKKSLDDYYYQLRIAEKYNFDFTANLNQSVSFLRKFVKKNVPKRQKKNKKQEIPNHLSIIHHLKFPKNSSAQIRESTNNLKQQKIGLHIQQKQLSLSQISDLWHRLGYDNNFVYDEQDSFFDQFKNHNQIFDRIQELNRELSLPDNHEDLLSK